MFTLTVGKSSVVPQCGIQVGKSHGLSANSRWSTWPPAWTKYSQRQAVERPLMARTARSRRCSDSGSYLRLLRTCPMHAAIGKV
jgi:hypothetical protein